MARFSTFGADSAYSGRYREDGLYVGVECVTFVVR